MGTSFAKNCVNERPGSDTVCSLAPYFEIQAGCEAEFRDNCEALVQRTRSEPDCLYYSFTFSGNMALCREGYTCGEALLHHLQNVDDLLKQHLTFAKLSRIEFHGPLSEWEKVEDALRPLGCVCFEVGPGFARL
eukprot:NODE_4500_length_575_cov_297.515209_g3268_i0.p1 GENE.NODE_4500_length_575_cov_297.515209_g3268_i0~~NODE_4500_length_575_cov_297.515209_g3268_i0.p1  ORF type:complete len:153 (-),score=47.44 NODE_4500_length_575_cov_297.515209_g3268_i0:115-516(-)